MRMRRKKHREQRIDACGSVFTTEVNFDHTYLEIGCGKGDFITELAQRKPSEKFLAFEKNPDVALLAGEKVLLKGLNNVKIFIGDVKPYLEEAKPCNCKGIYINFCDPWHKSSYRKRRLTHGVFLDLYRKILGDEGMICFKTDNRPLFEFSLASFSQNGYYMDNISLDLHADNPPDNIETEYERVFSSQGFPIYYLEGFVKKIEKTIA